MKTLFPKMDEEIAQDRLASRRESMQRAREFLAKHLGFEEFIIKYLTKHGPSADLTMSVEMADLCDVGTMKQALTVMGVAWAMWSTRKLWRKEFKNHPCGEKVYIYGIRGVHPNQKTK